MVKNILQTSVKGCANGLQSILMMPLFDTKKDCWSYHLQFKSVQPPCGQIHHNGQSHWVTSLQGDSGKVYLFDSSFHGLLSASLEIQLGCLYGKHVDSIKVYVPLWQQQAPGSNDCGVFAIGNLVEFCLNGYRKTDEWVRERKWQFKMEGARKYLEQCLEDESFVLPAHYGFPKDYPSSPVPEQC